MYVYMYVSGGNTNAGEFLLLVCFGHEFVDQISSMLHNSFPPPASAAAHRLSLSPVALKVCTPYKKEI